ncbi:hypothetical protein JCM17844_12130 [Iodidimonas gelatinilytica]|uniref:HemY N-terminal domain-containing protein n=1 Tax=Iodidimonas gelatinilytica TaxID=1236966 RepID=A0A5A7MNZ3_9PROT|nr:heme biosynthesis HemY N-terminal domain-containing protein [Iodidimonas gelatinilytica]GEQ97576.1 hypothetical protein JCM17844_12130 [Iodidimonas gelatinilytica]
MIRLLIYVLLIVAAAFGAAWFADNPGTVRMEWLGYRAETSMTVLGFLLALLVFTGMAVQKLITLIARDLPFSAEKRRKRRLEKGYVALNQAMVALSAGDKKLAQRLTNKAVRLLPSQPLTHVMAAEAAKLADNPAQIRAHYEALAESKEAAFLGLRGLVGEARASGETAKARALATQALALRPKSIWALKTVFDFAVASADWGDALAVLEKAERAGVFEKPLAKRHRGALLYCQAVEADLAGDEPSARRLSMESVDLRPDLAPAVALAAKLLQAAGQAKKAEKRILSGWAAGPHPLLLKAWFALAADEPAHMRLKRVETLCAKNPAHLESIWPWPMRPWRRSALIWRARLWRRPKKAAIGGF